MLVGRVNGVAIQTGTHQNGLAFQFLFKQSHNRNTSATSLWNWRFSKRFLISLFRSLVTQTINRRNISLPAVMRFHFYANTRWGNTFEVFRSEERRVGKECRGRWRR